MWLGESELEDASRLVPPRGSARGARDGASSRGGRTSADDPLDRRETEPEDVSDVSLVGAVAVFRGERGGWRAHEHVVRQAPRLAHLAQAAGAVAVVFLWPDRAPKYPPRRACCPAPTSTRRCACPRSARPHRRSRRWSEPTGVSPKRDETKLSPGGARVLAEPRDGEGSAARAARRCGAALVRAHVAAPQRTRRRGAREPARQLRRGARARPALARARA